MISKNQITGRRVFSQNSENRVNDVRFPVRTVLPYVNYSGNRYHAGGHNGQRQPVPSDERAKVIHHRIKGDAGSQKNNRPQVDIMTRSPQRI